MGETIDDATLGFVTGVERTWNGLTDEIAEDEYTKVAIDMSGDRVAALMPGRHWDYRSEAFRSGDPIAYLVKRGRRIPGQILEGIGAMAMQVVHMDVSRAAHDARAALTVANLRRRMQALYDTDPYDVGRALGRFVMRALTLRIGIAAGGAAGTAAGEGIAAVNEASHAKAALRLVGAGVGVGSTVPAVREVVPIAWRVGQWIGAGAGVGGHIVNAVGHDDRADGQQASQQRPDAERARPRRPAELEAETIKLAGKQLEADIAAGRVRLRTARRSLFGMTRTAGKSGMPVYYVRLSERSSEAAVRREEAAYAVDRVIGTDVVPLTGLIYVDGKLASFQQGVVGVTAHDDYSTVRKIIAHIKRSPALTAEYKSQVERVLVLDMTTGNPDRHMGNVVFMTGDRSHIRLAAIDNHLGLPRNFYIDNFSTGKTRRFGSPDDFKYGMHLADFDAVLKQPMEPSTRSLILAIDTRGLDELLAARGITKDARLRLRDRVIEMKWAASHPGSSIFDAFGRVENLLYLQR